MNPLAIRIAADLKAFKANMAEMKSQLETNQAAMKRMANSFDGSKVISDANAMVKAIHDIGGASKLTEAEQKRVNATVTEAIAKYKALGREAPAELHALRDATKQVQAATASVAAPVESLSSRLKSMAGTLGLAFGGAAVVSGLKELASGALDYAEQITDLSNRMGVSAETAQRWKFAADQTGSSLESVQKAVIKLSDGIASGDKGLIGGLKAAGLNFAQLKAMKPDEAFEAAVTAIEKIQNPMDQARVALELFGKAGAELLPAIREGFIRLADGAKTMSNDTIARLDEAKDNLERFKNDVTIIAGETIGAIARIREENEMLTQFRYDQAGASAKAYAGAVDSVAGAVKNAQAGLRAGLIPAVMSAEDAEKAYIAAGGKSIEVMNTETEAALRLAEAFQKQVDVLTGKALTREVAELAKQVEAAGKQGGLTAYQYAELGKKLDDLKSKGANLPNSLHDIWLAHERLNPSIKVTTDAYKMLADAMKLTPGIKLGMAPPPLPLPVSDDPFGIIEQVNRYLPKIKLSAAPAAKTWVDGFKSFIGQAGPDMIGSIVRAIEGGGNFLMAALGTLASNAGQFFTAKFKSEVDAAGKRVMSDSMAGFAGGVVSGIIGVGASIIADMLKPVYTALEQVAMATHRTTREVEADLRSMGAVGQKAFEDMTSHGLTFANMLRRLRGIDDANSLLGLLGQFQTKDELDKIAAQWKATYDYMLSSGKYTAAQLAEAWKQYEAAQQNAIGAADPEDSRPIGARGFPTKAQLQQAVREAKEAYEYIRDSGLYTADVIEQAWQQWQDAMIKSGDETAKRMKDLQSEIASLQKAVEAETPEYDANGVRIYGVEEQRNIERLAALEKEKAALTLAQIEAEKNATQVAAEKASLQADKEFEAAKIRANNLDDYLRKLFSGGYEIPITFRFPNGASAPTAPSWFGGSLGTQPAPSGGGSTMATIHITTVNQMDGEVVARKTVKHTARLLPNELTFIGARR